MGKVVISTRHGGFGLSSQAIQRYADIKGFEVYLNPNNFSPYLDPPSDGKTFKQRRVFSVDSIPRDDPVLVQVVEEMGDAANGPNARLEIVELPSGTHYFIDEYDGYEEIQTRDGIKWSVAI